MFELVLFYFRSIITEIVYCLEEILILTCRKEGPLPLEEVIKDYVRLAVDCDNNTSNTKYCVAQMLQSAMEGPQGKALLAAANMREIWYISLQYCSPSIVHFHRL